MENLEAQISLFEGEGDELAVDVISHSPKKPTSRQAMLGQYLTPPSIARFMASQFSPAFPTETRLLDAGAGRGALSVAFIERWQEVNTGGKLEAVAYETDRHILPELSAELFQFRRDNVIPRVVDGDFVELAATMVALDRGPRFTHAILNPPYKKINSASAHRAQLRAAGVETVNLYSGFTALALALLDAGGELVAIIPRSFCNGPYYQPFRRFILRHAAIERIHLFESRTKAFKDDGVLQENVIIKLIKGKPQTEVLISTSTDDTFFNFSETQYAFDRIVLPDDENQFIHIPTGQDDDDLLKNSTFGFTMADLGLKVSTGPVVDFRMREHLFDRPETGTVPLLYPGHFTNQTLEWPRESFKKPNAIRDNASTRKWLYPNGHYTVVRRFSSKEEKRRLVASVIDPATLPADWIGIENHLNVIHDGRKPLPENLARGLCVYLNSSAIEQYFRRFNGHTQVNATDLRTLPYPNRKVLAELGKWAKTQSDFNQEAIDKKVNGSV